MADTVIAPDLNEHWKQDLASEEQDVPAITIDVCVLRTLIERCSKAEQERDALRAEIERLKAKVVRLEAAISWALGEAGSDFRGRRENEGPYWWRKEFRIRARGREGE